MGGLGLIKLGNREVLVGDVSDLRGNDAVRRLVGAATRQDKESTSATRRLINTGRVLRSGTPEGVITNRIDRLVVISKFSFRICLVSSPSTSYMLPTKSGNKTQRQKR